MNFFKILFLVILAFPLLTFAQSTNKHLEKEKLLDLFKENDPWKTTKDSSAAYAFSFKVIVKKNLKGVAEIISIGASDSIAYKIYPNYKFLETINYNVFMGNNRTAIFIIPVGLEIIGSTGHKISRSDFFKDIMSLFHYKPNDKTEPEKFIYFEPYLVRLSKQVFD